MSISIIQNNADRMMSCRGYHFSHRDDNIFIYENNNSHYIILFYFHSEKLNIDAIKDFILLLEKKKIQHGIILYNGNVTSSTKKILEHMHKFKIELFSFKEFRYCLIDHQLYCPHRRLLGE